MTLPQQYNPWQYKPWWCQPWSILLTGAIVIASSWIITKTLWATGLVALPILAWWTYFLILWPRLIKSQLSLSNSSASKQTEDT